MFNNIPQNTEEYPNANNSICRKVLLEKSTDSDETHVDTLERPKSPDQNEPDIEIVTSPIRHDTPTRNKEFLDNTLEISPIKNNSSRNLDFDQKVDEGNPDEDKSPELFSETNEKEVVISECLTPVLPKRKNKFDKNRELSRGAQMMNLINGNCKINDNNTPNKDSETPNLKQEPRVSTPIVSNSRISKMMIQFDNKNMDKIEENCETPSKNEPEKEEDFLKFTKTIPLPSASPRFGILRKVSPGTPSTKVCILLDFLIFNKFSLTLVH